MSEIDEAELLSAGQRGTVLDGRAPDPDRAAGQPDQDQYRHAGAHPGTRDVLGAGDTHNASDPGTGVVGVIAQYKI